VSDELVHLGIPTGISKRGEHAPRPPWLRVRVKDTATYRDVGKLLDGLNLHTVCEEARCPNIWECWGEHKTATLMILGDVCTKTCRYCSVGKGKPLPPDVLEPEHVATAVERLGLMHAVITSVDRDDLADLGSGHWASVIGAIRARNPRTRIELLIPDFLGDETALHRVLDAKPDIVGHNVETVPSLYKRMRPKGSYARALELLARAHTYRGERGVPLTTKTGIMVGMGETVPELLEVMDALRRVNCDVVTFGQYLNPTRQHAPIVRYYTPEDFGYLKEQALLRGFLHCESGPLVRSSYHAHEHVPAGVR
jgi:lipoyl synthase